MKRAKLRTFVELFSMTADGKAIFDSRFEVETSHPWFTETDGAGQTVICFPPADPETDPVVKRLGGWRWSLHYKVESIH